MPPILQILNEMNQQLINHCSVKYVRVKGFFFVIKYLKMKISIYAAVSDVTNAQILLKC
jgi:hypothetical protein